MSELDENQVLITVTGKDKVGIVAKFSDALQKHKVNIEDIKQTIMQNNFVMIMLCDLSQMEVSFKDFKIALEEVAKSLEMEIWVQKKEIFDKMHTI